MKIYPTTEFRRRLAECLAEATIETVYILRPGNTMLQLVIVPQKDVDTLVDLSK